MEAVQGKMVTELKHMEQAPSEKVAQQMWQLLQMNYPAARAATSMVCKAVQQLPWCSIGCEQGHVGASIMERYHPGIQEHMLEYRSFLYQLQPMISPGEQWARVAAMQKEIDKLLTKDPLKFSSRQLFFQEAMEKVGHTDANYCAKQQAKEMIMATHSEK